MSEHEDRINPVDMVGISEKQVVHRTAEAAGRIILRKETLKAIKNRMIKKGDPFPVAEVAGILAVKKTSELIPLCHPIPLTKVDVSFKMGEEHVEARCMVVADYKTGVEMEALTGVTVALLTLWDMVKYLEKDEEGQYPTTRITDIQVVKKRKE